MWRKLGTVGAEVAKIGHRAKSERPVVALVDLKQQGAEVAKIGQGSGLSERPRVGPSLWQQHSSSDEQMR